MTFGSPRSTSRYSDADDVDGIQPEPSPRRARHGSPPTLKDEALMLELGMSPLTSPSGSAHSERKR